MKSEFVGYIDANNPPQCKSLKGDGGLKPIASKRLSNFVKAVRSTNRQWLNQPVSYTHLTLPTISSV